MPEQKKPKVTIGPDGTIHVDNGDDKTPKPSGTPAVAKTAKSNSANASQKLNAENKVKSNAKMPVEPPVQDTKPPAASSTSSKSSDEPQGCLWSVFGAIAGTLLIGGVCAGIGLLMMSGLGMIPLVIGIIIVVICVLGGSTGK